MGPGNKPNILQLIAGAEPLGAMRRAYDSAGRTVLLRDMVGGALSVYAAALIARTGGTHVFVAEDRDAAAYLLNDFYALLDEKQVYFFPGSYKRSIVYGTEDAQGVVQRTAALSALRREMAAGEYRIICTYPEGSAERVTDPDSMRRETVRVKVGDRLAIGRLEELLADSGFTKVDFVYGPGTVFAAWRYLRRVFLFREQTLPVGLFRGRGGFDPPIRDFQSAFPPTG